MKWNRQGEVCVECGKPILNTGAAIDCECGQAGAIGKLRRPRILCGPDWLDDVPVEWLADLFKLIHDTPNLSWCLRTEKPEKWRERVNTAARWLGTSIQSKAVGFDMDKTPYSHREVVRDWLQKWLEQDEPPPNVWLGVSVENQAAADDLIPKLLSIQASKRFVWGELSGPVRLDRCSPYALNGNVDNPGFLNAFNGVCHHPATCITSPPKQGDDKGIGWCVIGGGKEPCNVEWLRSLVAQCRAASVPVWVTRLGSVRNMAGVGDHGQGFMPGKFKDKHGADMAEWPEDLRGAREIIK